MTEDKQPPTASQGTPPDAASAVTPNDKRIIPHMIYLLSFVLNVRGQHDAGGTLLKPQEREPIRVALNLDPEHARRMNDNLPETLDSQQLRNFNNAFVNTTGYPGHGGGCPTSVAALVDLAKQWRAGAP